MKVLAAFRFCRHSQRSICAHAHRHNTAGLASTPLWIMISHKTLICLVYEAWRLPSICLRLDSIWLDLLALKLPNREGLDHVHRASNQTRSHQAVHRASPAEWLSLRPSAAEKGPAGARDYTPISHELFRASKSAKVQSKPNIACVKPIDCIAQVKCPRQRRFFSFQAHSRQAFQQSQCHWTTEL